MKSLLSNEAHGQLFVTYPNVSVVQVFQTNAQLTKQIHTGSLSYYNYSFFLPKLLVFTTATSVVRLS